jgi:hypothetical protein
MKISEVISDIERQRSQNLDRNAAQASFQAKQEHFRQRLNQYNERLRKRKAGGTVPKRPEPPEQPKPITTK